MKDASKLSYATAAIAFTISQPAYAYLDPGTGSVILQMLIAGVIGALFTIKMYWYRLKHFVTNLFRNSHGESASADRRVDNTAAGVQETEQDRPKTSD